MKIETQKHRIGKFQLPRQAHVMEVTIELDYHEKLGMITVGSKTPKLWMMERADDQVAQELLAPICPIGATTLEETNIKRMVREAAELGDVLHLQVKVAHGPNAVHLHSFITVAQDFDPSTIEFHTMRKTALVNE